jgi:hypothetical protein
VAHHHPNNNSSGYNPFADNPQDSTWSPEDSTYNPFSHDATHTERYSPSTNDLIDLQQGSQSSPVEAVPSSSSTRQPPTNLQDPSSAHFRTNRKSKQGNKANRVIQY